MQGGTSQRRKDCGQEENHSQDLVSFLSFVVNLKKSAFVFNEEKDEGQCGAVDCLGTFVKGFPSISRTSGSADSRTPLLQTAWLGVLSYIRTPFVTRRNRRFPQTAESKLSFSVQEEPHQEKTVC